MDDASRARVTYDLLREVAKYLDEKELANLAAANQDLSEPLSRLALKRALTRPPFVENSNDEYQVVELEYCPKPLVHAIEYGDVQLLSRAFNLLDILYPQGWIWWHLYGSGVDALLELAAERNLVSLQFLLTRFPLLPSSSQQETGSESEFEREFSVPDNSLYSEGTGSSSTGVIVDMRNGNLVRVALQSGRYDCASFLLRLEPPLFPRGFELGMHRVCYTSATTLQFLINHGAHVSDETLHRVAAMDNLPDTRVFDILVQSCGLDVNSSRSSTEEWLTPLSIACDGLQSANIDALLRLGAEPNGDTWVRRDPFLLTEFHYTSPNPILTLLFTHFWDTTHWKHYQRLGRKFIRSLQSLLRHGASVSMPMEGGSILEVFVLRIWKCICHEVMNRPGFTLPECPDHPDDVNPGVQSMLLALNDVTVSPWDEVCQIISDVDPGWREIVEQAPGKAQLVKILRHYQERYRDLPRPDITWWRSQTHLPDRFRY
ncbi:hypothetical protein F5B17DRAFT_387630 [Nemania serpens]|nr:hypothetical protein F5B17DRAFT_387630 [Nemania serpens]